MQGWKLAATAMVVMAAWSSASAGIVTVSGTPVSTDPGDTFPLSVSLDTPSSMCDVDGLCNAGFRITFDATRFSMVRVDDGDLPSAGTLPGASWYDPGNLTWNLSAPGLLEISMIALYGVAPGAFDPAMLPGPATLFTLKMATLSTAGAGSTSFDVAPLDPPTFDFAPASAPIGVNGGGTVPEPGTALLAAFGLLALTARARHARRP